MKNSASAYAHDGTNQSILNYLSMQLPFSLYFDFGIVYNNEPCIMKARVGTASIDMEPRFWVRCPLSRPFPPSGFPSPSGPAKGVSQQLPITLVMSCVAASSSQSEQE